MHDSAPGFVSHPADAPATIEDSPISIDAAAALMARFGFVAFRTPPGSPVPDSCLMAILRDRPTLAHFDPELVSYWTPQGGHGRLATVDLTTPMPISRHVSWGRIDITDRLAMRNSFVTFGGHLDANPVGRGMVLVIVRSPAPILRLSGHSQWPDTLAQEAVAFFARLLPRLWDQPTTEQRLNRIPPEALWAAFLIDEHARIAGSGRITEQAGEVRQHLQHALSDLMSKRPAAVGCGRELLHDLGLRGN